MRRPAVGLTAARAPLPPVPALCGVDVGVRAGEVLAVVGTSGAGKSTLTALLAGVEAPTSGAVVAADWLAGGAGASPGRWTSPELARRVGWVPQQAELAVVSRTVRDDVLSTSRLLGLDQDAAGRRADALLEVLGLAHLAGTDPHRLSGGEMRRLALAGAVAHGPAVLVLDEPTVGQDRLTWAAVAGVVVAARSAGVAVVLATHDPLLTRLADRTVRLEGGRVVSGATAPARTTPAAGTVRSAVRLPLSAPPLPRPLPPLPLPAPSARTPGLAGACGPLSLLAASAVLLAGSLFVRDLRTALLALGVELLLAPAVLGLRRPSSVRGGRPAAPPPGRPRAGSRPASSVCCRSPSPTGCSARATTWPPG